MVTGILAAALALAACSGGSGSSASNAAELATFYRQELHWKPCTTQEAADSGLAADAGIPVSLLPTVIAGFQCTQLTVPLNYANPGGATIKLALNRLPATDQAHRIGALVTNPGGPGGSGLELGFSARAFFTPQLLARYDIIGMDPRGVGLSSPVTCKTPASTPADPVAAATVFARACEQTSGKILPYVGTDNAARDLDIARAALGDARLDYYGVSYGTLLGQYYAQMFPHQVGRMVLDSVDSPASSTDPPDQARAFETTLQVLAQTCVDRGHCPMGSSRQQILARFDQLLARLQSKPMPAIRGSTPLNAGDLLSALQDTLSNEQDWPAAEAELAALFVGKQLAAPAGPAGQATQKALGSSQGDEQDGSFQAIYCPTVPQDQRTVAAAEAAGREAQQVAPHFAAGTEQVWLSCAEWPVRSPAMAGQAIRAPGTPTILLVNNTYDPRTPVGDARVVQADLANSVLVTNEGAGHGFYQMGPCTHKVVDDYLLTGVKPKPGPTCHDRPALATAP
jgi:pimeloyl-ACP methyl ester carboxylesterase